MKRLVVIAVVALTFTALMAPAAFAKTGRGSLYHDGEIVRTIVPPAASPQTGVDDFYAVMNGADGQLGVAAVAPGDPGYHGGKWAFHAVTFADDVEPYLLTSAAAVHAAESVGDVTVQRIEEMDFKCPIQP